MPSLHFLSLTEVMHGLTCFLSYARQLRHMLKLEPALTKYSEVSWPVASKSIDWNGDEKGTENNIWFTCALNNYCELWQFYVVLGN